MVCWCNQWQHLGAAAFRHEARRPKGSGTETWWWDGWAQHRSHPHKHVGLLSWGALRGPQRSEATVRRKVFSLCHMQEHHSGQGQWKAGATGGWGLYPWPMRPKILSAITCWVFPVTVCVHQLHSASAVETGSWYWDRQSRKWRRQLEKRNYCFCCEFQTVFHSEGNEILYDCFKKKKKRFYQDSQRFLFWTREEPKALGPGHHSKAWGEEDGDMKVPTPLEEEEPGRTMVSLSRNLPSSLTRPVGSEPCWWCQTETAAWLPWLTMQSCYPWRGPCRWPPSALHSPASVVKKKATGSPQAFRGEHCHLGHRAKPITEQVGSG